MSSEYYKSLVSVTYNDLLVKTRLGCCVRVCGCACVSVILHSTKATLLQLPKHVCLDFISFWGIFVLYFIF